MPMSGEQQKPPTFAGQRQYLNLHFFSTLKDYAKVRKTFIMLKDLKVYYGLTEKYYREMTSPWCSRAIFEDGVVHKIILFQISLQSSFRLICQKGSLYLGRNIGFLKVSLCILADSRVCLRIDSQG